MPTEHRIVLRDDGGRHDVVGMREGQREILLKETTIPNEVT